MASNLQAILENARTNAAALVPSPAPATNGNLPTTAKASRLLDFDDLGGSFTVDIFLKVSEAGIKIGNNGKFRERLDVVMDTSAVQASKAISASRDGQPPKYWRTYDGVMTLSGIPWEQAISEAQQIKPGAVPYSSADIPVRLLQEVDGVGTDKILGMSLTKSQYGPFDTFRKAMLRKGLWGQELPITLGFRVGKMQGVRDWGIYTFELLESALDVAAE